MAGCGVRFPLWSHDDLDGWISLLLQYNATVEQKVSASYGKRRGACSGVPLKG